MTADGEPWTASSARSTTDPPPLRASTRAAKRKAPATEPTTSRKGKKKLVRKPASKASPTTAVKGAPSGTPSVRPAAPGPTTDSGFEPVVSAPAHAANAELGEDTAPSRHEPDSVDTAASPAGPTERVIAVGAAAVDTAITLSASAPAAPVTSTPRRGGITPVAPGAVGITPSADGFNLDEFMAGFKPGLGGGHRRPEATQPSALSQAPTASAPPAVLRELELLRREDQRLSNQVTGELEDKLLDDVMYISNTRVNIISLGYMQMKVKFKLVCSDDQRTAWLSKLGTALRFDMRDNIYRLRVAHVAGATVNTVQKGEVDGKNTMELLHQRFSHLSMDTVKMMTNKLNVGVKINAKDLSSYDCVACNASKAKGMHHARCPMRKQLPLAVLVMDVCFVNEASASGATMFLFGIDEATRFKWAYLLEKKSEATHYIIKLLNELRTQFQLYKVQRLFSDQGGEFESNELLAYCEDEGIILLSTNAYSQQENGITERANGVALPRIRAMLTATHMPDLLWGETLLNVVETLNVLPTKPLALVSSHEKLYRVPPDLSVLRTWGCLSWVRIPPESRQRKEKLKLRARLSLLLGYSDSTKGYKFLGLTTCQVQYACNACCTR
ncbi:Integrase, catalytic core protein [Phytophthora cinnamomi]|uniref:Integrase, catalytic core protein n=1 Tax=Phytophthora cinnamomi TaxID=4785 RepID=UPI0035599EED|nr:Integrase, catalytic core protein [Phytophthora cinnamomi]